jgi:hypothetical protein
MRPTFTLFHALGKVLYNKSKLPFMMHVLACDEVDSESGLEATSISLTTSLPNHLSQYYQRPYKSLPKVRSDDMYMIGANRGVQDIIDSIHVDPDSFGKFLFQNFPKSLEVIEEHCNIAEFFSLYDSLTQPKFRGKYNSTLGDIAALLPCSAVMLFHGTVPSGKRIQMIKPYDWEANRILRRLSSELYKKRTCSLDSRLKTRQEYILEDVAYSSVLLKERDSTNDHSRSSVSVWSNQPNDGNIMNTVKGTSKVKITLLAFFSHITKFTEYKSQYQHNGTAAITDSSEVLLLCEMRQASACPETSAAAADTRGSLLESLFDLSDDIAEFSD